MHDKAIAARVLRDTGKFTLEELADILGTSKSTIHRWIESQPKTLESSALADLEELLSGQELDAHGQFRAGIARGLAMKLDKMAVSDKGQDSQNVAQVAKELDEIVARILDVSSDDREWLINVFAPVGNPEDPKP